MHLKREGSPRKTARNVLLPILTGLLTAQIIATCFVYGSNLRLHAVVRAAQDVGYFVIPAGPVTATLTTFRCAVWGGLFYTLSIGVGLTLISWVAVHFWQTGLRRKTWVLLAYLLLWAALLVWLNRRGLTLYPLLFGTLVPLATILATINDTPSSISQPDRLKWIPVATLVLLTALWATRFNNDLFSTIRDHILLSNPIGRQVNDFYYRYTLYAAQSFKSISQKTVRSYDMKAITDTQLASKLVHRLAQYDTLYLSKAQQPDFTVTLQDNQLVLTTFNGKRLFATPQEILAKPNTWLQQISKMSDCYAPLRRVTLLGLLIGFPILLYILIYSLSRMVLGLVLPDRTATLATSGLCLVVGLLLFVPMLAGRAPSISKQNLPQALISERWPQRVAALRFIEAKKIDIGRYPEYKPLLDSPLVVERYWLARAMAHSRRPDTFADLKYLMDDTHPNVTCQVYFALGHRGNRSAIVPIRTQLGLSNHWYAQWYGYRALRRLGWNPSRSN